LVFLGPDIFQKTVEEKLLRPVAFQKYSRSFDYVRLVPHFAQDDNLLGGERRKMSGGR
jgi:hypothetical protein